MADYEDSYGDYDDISTSTSSPSTATAGRPSTTIFTTLISTNTNEKLPPPVPEVTPWGGPFGPSSKMAATPEAEVSSIPENPSVGQEHPFGEGNPEWAIVGEPEGNPEGEPEAEPVFIGKWTLHGCTGYTNPFAAPEPEAEPGAEPVAEGYPEPPAPLLQSVNFRDRGVYSTFAAAIAALIIFLNIAILVALAKKPKQRKTLSYFIGVVAAFDLLGGLQFLWFSSFDLHLMYTHADIWILVMCGIWMLSMAPQIAATMHFGLHLFNEKTMGEGNAKVGEGMIVFIILTVFLLPIAIFIPPVAGWNCIGCSNLSGDEYCERKCSIPIFPFTKIYVLLMTLLLLLAMAAVVGIYIMLHFTRSTTESVKSPVSKSGKCDAMALSQRMLITYIVCTLPVAVVMLADYSTVYCNPQLINAFHATLFVTYLSNLVNPFLVFAMAPSMRNVFAAQSDTEVNKHEGNGVNEAFSLEEGSNGIHDTKLAMEEEASRI